MASTPTTTKIVSFSGKNRFLSNFYPAVVEMDDELYAAVEHAFQAAKCIDIAKRADFRAPHLTAAGAKQLGRRVVRRPDWKEVQVHVMRELLYEKFTGLHNPRLAEQLLDTGDAELIEGNWWGDTFWGVCGGVGENWLGRLLMEVRGAIELAQI